MFSRRAVKSAVVILPIYSGSDFNELLVQFGILKAANPRSGCLGGCSTQAGANDPFRAFATGYFLRYTVGPMAQQDAFSTALRVIGQINTRSGVQWCSRNSTSIFSN